MNSGRSESSPQGLDRQGRVLGGGRSYCYKHGQPAGSRVLEDVSDVLPEQSHGQCIGCLVGSNSVPF
eukprot:2011976-Amphidinium_carterae.2